MKGPSQRLKFDLRRIWECPRCQRRERTSGAVAHRECLCQMKQADGQPVIMRLVEDGPRRVLPPVSISHETASEPAPPAVAAAAVEPPAVAPPENSEPPTATS